MAALQKKRKKEIGSNWHLERLTSHREENYGISTRATRMRRSQARGLGELGSLGHTETPPWETHERLHLCCHTEILSQGTPFQMAIWKNCKDNLEETENPRSLFYS